MKAKASMIVFMNVVAHLALATSAPVLKDWRKDSSVRVNAAFVDDYRRLHKRPGLPDTEIPPDDVVKFNPSMVTDPTHFLSSYEMVIWINIAEPQSGIRRVPIVHAETGQFLFDGAGRQISQLAQLKNANRGQTALIWYKKRLQNQFGNIIISSGNPNKGDGARETPTGWFVIDSVNNKTFYADEHPGWLMPYAMFFYLGVALHELPPNTSDQMGEPNSHGCPRLPSLVAKWMYEKLAPYREGWTKENPIMGNSVIPTTYVPMFTRSGHPIKDVEGNDRMSDTMTEADEDRVTDKETKRSVNEFRKGRNLPNINGRYFPAAVIIENRNDIYF